MQKIIQGKIFWFVVAIVALGAIRLIAAPQISQFIALWVCAAWIYLFHEKTIRRDKSLLAPLLVAFFITTGVLVRSTMEGWFVNNKLDSIVLVCEGSSSEECEKILQVIASKPR